jgi:4'-phosphopantetheinyl transferase
MEPLPLSWWPQALAPRGDGLYVIGVRGDGERQLARRRVRQALCEALAQLYGLQVAQIMIHFSAGRAPAVSFLEAPAAIPPGISISHDGPLSVAAIHQHGPAGVDLMRVQDVPDWRAIARDYLAPHVRDQLESASPSQRPLLLAQAWTEMEACLKCHGRQLGEWTGQALPALCSELALPDGFAGMVAAYTLRGVSEQETANRPHHTYIQPQAPRTGY